MYRLPGMTAETDLTPAVRIRNAALQRFSEAGIADTSIRDIARATGLSPGLVQHHFRTKDGLRDAVNQHVTALLNDVLGDPNAYENAGDPVQAAGDRITAFIAANPTAMRYLGRALVEGDEAARAVFDAFVAVILDALRRLSERRALHADLDLEWAAMHLVVFNLATLLFERAIDGNLPAPFFEAGQLRRWNVATTELYRRGMFRPS